MFRMRFAHRRLCSLLIRRRDSFAIANSCKPTFAASLHESSTSAWATFIDSLASSQDGPVEQCGDVEIGDIMTVVEG